MDKKYQIYQAKNLFYELQLFAFVVKIKLIIL